MITKKKKSDGSTANLNRESLQADDLSVEVFSKGMPTTFMIMKDESQDPYKTQHRANEKLVIPLDPMKFELASTIK